MPESRSPRAWRPCEIGLSGSAELGDDLLGEQPHGRVVREVATPRDAAPAAEGPALLDLLADLLGGPDEVALLPRVEGFAPQRLRVRGPQLVLGGAHEHVRRPRLGDLVVVAPDRLAVTL